MKASARQACVAQFPVLDGPQQGSVVEQRCQLRVAEAGVAEVQHIPLKSTAKSTEELWDKPALRAIGGDRSNRSSRCTLTGGWRSTGMGVQRATKKSW
mmetsp:Transcript_68623/g.200819  ORF Transcript_68623/g.200819 Transcript_68623/m.200819 type:complete len:98 (-) Transcript_68623:434-727(-)